MKTNKSENTKKELENIARKFFKVETLETRNLDDLDFHEVSVWNMENALRAAFELGQKSAK